MPRKAKTIKDLCDELGLDYDIALVTLWDAGFDNINDIDYKIPRIMISGIHSALGYVSEKRMHSLTYWQQEWGLTRKETMVKLAEYGINTSTNARTLPKGALKKLRTETKSTVPAPEIRASEYGTEEPEFSWNRVGRERDCDLLDSSEILQIHEALVADFKESADPIDPEGVRDSHLLESAAFRPGTSLGDHKKYPSAELAGAALLHSIIHNHPFHNGNKRTALVSTLVFLDRNDILITCSEDDLFKFVLKVSQHRIIPASWSNLADREVAEMARWILRNSRHIEHGERPLKWRELRKSLSRFDCVIGTPLPGNKIKVQRRVRMKALLGLHKSKILSITVGYRNDGSEVASNILKNLRKELQLDEAHGVDSAHFYGGDTRMPDEFINEYRTLLKRLAKL